jgi:hypothetical protein
MKKEPILITEDGVPYYDENKLVWDTHDFSSGDPAIIVNPTFLDQTPVKYAKNIDRMFFHSKKKALEYMKDNIRFLALTDIDKLSNGINEGNIIINRKDLIKLLRKRINDENC